MFRVGSKGPRVVEWQVFLKGQGYFEAGFAPVFGPKTHAATLAFQRSQGLDADGIVGPNTLRAAERVQNPPDDDGQRMTLEDVAAVARIPLPVLKAVKHVESRGKPSAVRFEPHLFHRKRPDLAAEIPYTRSKRGYSLVKSETNRAALEHAMTIDAETAIKSTSFGSYQVLGGYLFDAVPGDANEVYRRFCEDPQLVSDLLVAAWFGDNAAARRAANQQPPDFAGLARSYNGPNYHVHKYDERLKTAWEKMQ
jgi:hypothetical protein